MKGDSPLTLREAIRMPNVNLVSLRQAIAAVEALLKHHEASQELDFEGLEQELHALFTHAECAATSEALERHDVDLPHVFIDAEKRATHSSTSAKPTCSRRWDRWFADSRGSGSPAPPCTVKQSNGLDSGVRSLTPLGWFPNRLAPQKLQGPMTPARVSPEVPVPVHVETDGISASR